MLLHYTYTHLRNIEEEFDGDSYITTFKIKGINLTFKTKIKADIIEQ